MGFIKKHTPGLLVALLSGFLLTVARQKAGFDMLLFDHFLVGGDGYRSL